MTKRQIIKNDQRFEIKLREFLCGCYNGKLGLSYESARRYYNYLSGYLDGIMNLPIIDYDTADRLFTLKREVAQALKHYLSAKR
jgi:hypothetical protein